VKVKGDLHKNFIENDSSYFSNARCLIIEKKSVGTPWK
jgi:hypothetical protein